MKTIVFSVVLFFMSIGTSSAEWYIFNSFTNRCVGIAKYEKSKEDLDVRGEFSFFSKDEISIEDAEFFNGKIRVRTKSQEEKNKEKEQNDKKDKRIADFDSAKQKLINLGLTSDEVESLQ